MVEPNARPFVYSIEELERRHAEARHLWLEFLRVPTMSAGLYVLPTGAKDPQTPHHEDEVYVVLRGRATLRIRSDDRPVEPGTVAFVPREVPHHFHTVNERLVVVVVFAPAETVEDEPPRADPPARASRGSPPTGGPLVGGSGRDDALPPSVVAPESSDSASDVEG